MPSLSFPSDEALYAAITAELVPPEVVATPAAAWRDDGQLWVRTEASIGQKDLARLEAVGVKKTASRAPAAARRAESWLELLPAAQVGEPDEVPKSALLVLDDAKALLEVAAELIRLGCDRQRYQLDPEPVLWVDAPPYYTLLRAHGSGAHGSGASPMRAFLPTRRSGVWTEIGYAHRLAERCSAEKGTLLLIAKDGFRRLADGPWSDIDKLIEIALPGAATSFAPRSLRERLVVRLRLARTGQVRVPTLWVLRDRPIEQLERLTADLTHEVLDALLFAVGDLGDGKEVVALRVRAGSAPIELAVQAERYAPHPQLPTLLLPCDAMLEPPLSRDRLRALGGDDNAIAWLRPTGEPGGAFVLEQAKDDAFSPLADVIDYVVSKSERALEPWVRAAVFDLDILVRGDAVADRPRRGAAAVQEVDDEIIVDEDVPVPPTPRPKKKRSKKAPARADEPATAEVRSETELERRIRELERVFLDVEVGEAERLEMWLELARAYAAAGRREEAAHGFARVLWDRDDATVAREWAAAEGVGIDADSLAELLARPFPARDDMRALTALLVADARPRAAAELEQLGRHLDGHQENLDVRARWLAQTTLCRLTGGDALRLTRARDAILRELRGGLSVDRDVPAFLRVRVTGHGDVDTANTLSAELMALETRVVEDKRTRSAIEAPAELTRAYTRRLFACALARLGKTREAEARAAMPDPQEATDAVHRALFGIFDERVRQAVAGMSPTAPLSGTLTAALNDLSTFERYKVDRLREASRVLEPTERLDAVRGFQRAEKDPRGDEFAALRSLDAGPELSARIDAIVERACHGDTTPEERARLLDGAMDFFYSLPASQAVTLLERLCAQANLAPVELFYRTLLVEEALVLAAHFGHEQLIAQLSSRLADQIAELGPERIHDVTNVLEGALRTLRRVGLKAQAASLLDLTAKLAQGGAPELLLARAHVGAGFRFLGDEERAAPFFAEAKKALGGELPIKERLALTRALCDAAAELPVPARVREIAQLAAQLPKISDSFSTNSHFCLSLVHFVESLVTGLVPPDRGRDGPAAAYLDADENLVRRRIHRESREALS